MSVRYSAGVSRDLRGVIWDWGGTLMRDIPGQAGPMVEWPRVEAMPGAALALRRLGTLPVQCVATNAAESGAAQVAAALARVGLRDHFTHFLTSRELGVKKPDPEFFSHVAREVGLPPDALLAVGNDHLKDIAPARAVGMTTVLVTRDPDATAPDAADIVVPDLAALARLLDGVGAPAGRPDGNSEACSCSLQCLWPDVLPPSCRRR